MATDTVDGMSAHMRGLTVTTIAAIAGLVAAIASNVVTGGDPKSQIGIGILAVSILVQFPILHVLGIEYDDLGVKDQLFIAFMTFSLWFIAWGILLTTAAL